MRKQQKGGKKQKKPKPKPKNKTTNKKYISKETTLFF